jgi:uncharacterized membrane protein YeaQ/YmgE (transglycosylase-associated protein family)
MDFLWMLVIGLIVGAIAKFVMPGKDPGGIIVTILIGIAGALLAGFLGRALGWYAHGDSAGFVASLVGAILLLVVYRLVTKGRSPRLPP